jgi:hypothetical protein
MHPLVVPQVWCLVKFLLANVTLKLFCAIVIVDMLYKLALGDKGLRAKVTSILLVTCMILHMNLEISFCLELLLAKVALMLRLQPFQSMEVFDVVLHVVCLFESGPANNTLIWPLISV